MTGLGKSMRVWLGLALIAGVSGCETLGNPLDVISGDRPTPDEFQVLARKPLKMPGTLDLPEPRLGEASPLEPDPTTDAVVALLGVPSATAAPQASAGEQALLSAANASAANSTSSAQLEEAEVRAEANRAFEAPLITDVFGVRDEPVTEDALVPDAEARRLQTEGVAATPVDPNAVPPQTASSEEAFDPSSRPTYETDDGKPQNRLPRANTTTAF